MPILGDWIQPDDLWLEVGRSYSQSGWAREFEYENVPGFSVFADRFGAVLNGTPSEFATLNSSAVGRTSWSDGGAGLEYTRFRRGYDIPNGGDLVASLDVNVWIFRVVCSSPSLFPKVNPEEYPPEYESLEFEGSGTYGPEHRYRVPYFADNQGDAPSTDAYRIAAVPDGSEYASGSIDRIPNFDAWTLSGLLGEGGGYVDLEIPSQSAAVTGVPESMLNADPTPVSPATLPHNIIGVGNSTALTGARTFTTWRRYTPPRYRFIFADPESATGYWTTRQRQTAGGNAGGQPLRQRHNGGHSGGWPLRQRQTGL